MSDELIHHGILGQKWGVRRTPAELGHAPSGGKGGSYEDGDSKKEPAKKSPGQSAKSVSSMSDDELRQRINRMNMEEQYEGLVARKNAKNMSTAKKLLTEALENLGRKSLGLAVDSLIAKMSNKGDKFDINDFKNVDVNGMDAETIAKVAKWYQNANAITASRERLKTASTPPSKDSDKGK